MDITKLRTRALEYFQRHRTARDDYRRRWTEWRRIHGGSTDQQIIFGQIPQTQWALEDEREFGRLALLWATVANMELNYQILQRLQKGDSDEEQ